MNLAEYSNRHILTQIRSKTKKEKRKVIYQIQREPFSWSLFKKEKKGVENLIQKRSNSHRLSLSLSLSLSTSQSLRNITIKRVKVLGNFKRHERKEKRKSKIFEKTRLVEEKKKDAHVQSFILSLFFFFLNFLIPIFLIKKLFFSF